MARAEKIVGWAKENEIIVPWVAWSLKKTFDFGGRSEQTVATALLVELASRNSHARKRLIQILGASAVGISARITDSFVQAGPQVVPWLKDALNQKEINESRYRQVAKILAKLIAPDPSITDESLLEIIARTLLRSGHMQNRMAGVILIQQITRTNEKLQEKGAGILSQHLRKEKDAAVAEKIMRNGGIRGKAQTGIRGLTFAQAMEFLREGSKEKKVYAEYRIGKLLNGDPDLIAQVMERIKNSRELPGTQWRLIASLRFMDDEEEIEKIRPKIEAVAAGTQFRPQMRIAAVGVLKEWRRAESLATVQAVLRELESTNNTETPLGRTVASAIETITGVHPVDGALSLSRRSVPGEQGIPPAEQEQIPPPDADSDVNRMTPAELMRELARMRLEGAL